MAHLLGRVLLLALPICGIDGLFPGVSRHTEDGVRIERVLGFGNGRRNLWTALLRLSLTPARLFFPLTRLLLLPQARRLFVARSLTALILVARLLSNLFLGLRPLLLRTFSGGMPQRLGSLVPAFRAQIARLWNVIAAHAACARGASPLDGEERAAGRGNQRDDTDANPYGRERRRPLGGDGQISGLNILRGERKGRSFGRSWTRTATIS